MYYVSFSLSEAAGRPVKWSPTTDAHAPTQLGTRFYRCDPYAMRCTLVLLPWPLKRAMHAVRVWRGAMTTPAADWLARRAVSCSGETRSRCPTHEI